MYDVMSQLNKEHTARQVQRMKAKAPVSLVTILIMAASIGLGIYLIWKHYELAKGITMIIAGLIVAVLWALSANLLTEWDRAVILRMGHFHAVKGPGFFMIVPIIDSVTRIVDMRVLRQQGAVDHVADRGMARAQGEV